jgi:hypothetical protein
LEVTARVSNFILNQSIESSDELGELGYTGPILGYKQQILGTINEHKFASSEVGPQGTNQEEHQLSRCAMVKTWHGAWVFHGFCWCYGHPIMI